MRSGEGSKEGSCKTGLHIISSTPPSNLAVSSVLNQNDVNRFAKHLEIPQMNSCRPVKTIPAVQCICSLITANATVT